VTRAGQARATALGWATDCCVALAGLAGVLVLAAYATVSDAAVGRVLLAGAVPVVGFGGVAVFGAYLARETPREHTRFVAGVGVATTVVALAVTGAFVALLEVSHGLMGSGLGFYVLYGTASAGLAGGVLVGHLHATQRRRTAQLQAANAELREQNERLDAFASIISHDLRNPLAVAAGYLELARESDTGSDLDDVTREHLAEVAACHDRIETLVDQVLALARMERDPAAVSAVDVAGVATDALETVPLGDGELVVETTAVVEIERGDLRQVFENLYRNAVEHAGPDPTIRVCDLEDDAGFAVEDDGPGIPEGDRDAVFDRGFSDGDGTGLGLAIVSEVAATYDWDVTVTDGRDDGARFEFRVSGGASDGAETTGASTETAGTSKAPDAETRGGTKTQDDEAVVADVAADGGAGDPDETDTSVDDSAGDPDETDTSVDDSAGDPDETDTSVDDGGDDRDPVSVAGTK
jgi:signal transduction histidine kinase